MRALRPRPTLSAQFFAKTVSAFVTFAFNFLWNGINPLRRDWSVYSGFTRFHPSSLSPWTRILGLAHGVEGFLPV